MPAAEHLATGQRQVIRQHRSRGVVDRLVAFDGHKYVPERQQDAAKQNRLAHTEKSVGDHAADQRQRVDKAGIGAQDIEPGFVCKQVILCEIQEQQVLHSVE